MNNSETTTILSKREALNKIDDEKFRRRVLNKIEKYSFHTAELQTEFQSILDTYSNQDQPYFRLIQKGNANQKVEKSMHQIESMLNTINVENKQTQVSSLINITLELSDDTHVPLFELFPELITYVNQFNRDTSMSFAELQGKVKDVLQSSKSVLFLTLFHQIAETNHPQKETLFIELKNMLQDGDSFSTTIFETFDHYTQLIELASLSNTYVETKRKEGIVCSFRQAWAETCLFLQKEGLDDALVHEIFHDVLSVRDAEELSQKLRDSFTDWILTTTQQFEEYTLEEELDEAALKRKRRWKMLVIALTLLPVGFLVVGAAMPMVDALLDVEGLDGERLFDFDLIPDPVDTPEANPQIFDPTTGLPLANSDLTPEIVAANFANAPEPSIEDANLDPDLPFSRGDRVTNVNNETNYTTFMMPENVNLGDLSDGTAASQTAEGLYRNSRVLVGEFRGDWQTRPGYLNSLSYNGLNEYGIGELLAPSQGETGTIIPRLEYTDEATLQYVDFKTSLQPNQYFILTHPLNEVPEQGTIHVFLNESYAGSYEIEVICENGNCFGRPVLNENDAAWVQENAANLSFEIALSYTNQNESNLSIESRELPIVEQPLLTLEDLPTNLQQEINDLLTNTELSQIEKIVALADWYRENITANSYSFDPRNHQAWYIAPFEWDSPIERERAFYRLFFGTNRAELGLEDSEFPIPYAHECTRATASFMHVSHLFLWELQNNGEQIQVQTQQNSGYLINSFYGETGNNVPSSSGHSFFTVVDLQTGQEINLDVTGNSLDDFTRDVYASLDSSQVDAGEVHFETNVTPDNEVFYDWEIPFDQELANSIHASTENNLTPENERNYPMEFAALNLNAQNWSGNINRGTDLGNLRNSYLIWGTSSIETNNNLTFNGIVYGLSTNLFYNPEIHDYQFSIFNPETAVPITLEDINSYSNTSSEDNISRVDIQIPQGVNTIPLSRPDGFTPILGLRIINSRGLEIPYTLFLNSGTQNYVLALDVLPLRADATFTVEILTNEEDIPIRSERPTLNSHDDFLERTQNYGLNITQLNHMYFTALFEIWENDVKTENETNLPNLNEQIVTILDESTSLTDSQRETMAFVLNSYQESSKQDQINYLLDHILSLNDLSQIFFHTGLLPSNYTSIINSELPETEILSIETALDILANNDIHFNTPQGLFYGDANYLNVLIKNIMRQTFGVLEPAEITMSNSVYTVCRATTSNQENLLQCLGSSPIIPLNASHILTNQIRRHIFARPYSTADTIFDIGDDGSIFPYQRLYVTFDNSTNIGDLNAPYDRSDYPVQLPSLEDLAPNQTQEGYMRSIAGQQITDYIHSNLERERNITRTWMLEYLVTELAKFNPLVVSKFAQLFLPLSFVTLAGAYGLSEVLTRWSRKGLKRGSIVEAFTGKKTPKELAKSISSKEITLLKQALKGEPINTNEARESIRKAAIQQVLGRPKVSVRSSPEILDTSLKIDQLPATVVLYFEDLKEDISFLASETTASISEKDIQKIISFGTEDTSFFKKNIYKHNKQKINNGTWKNDFENQLKKKVSGQEKWWYEAIIQIGYTIWSQLIKDWE